MDDLKDEVNALARGICVLRIVASYDKPIGNREIAELTGIPKSTVSRITNTLICYGLLKHHQGDDKYILGPTNLMLGSAYIKNFDYRISIRPYLSELADMCGANVNLCIRDGLDILVIDALKPTFEMILSRIDVGSKMSLLDSAAGRAYLAASDEMDIFNIIKESNIKDFKLKGDIFEIAKSSSEELSELGFCTSFGEWHPEVNAIAFDLPVIDNNKYVVSVGGPAYKLSKNIFLEKISKEVLNSKKKIENDFFSFGARF